METLVFQTDISTVPTAEVVALRDVVHRPFSGGDGCIECSNYFGVWRQWPCPSWEWTDQEIRRRE